MGPFQVQSAETRLGTQRSNRKTGRWTNQASARESVHSWARTLGQSRAAPRDDQVHVQSRSK